MKLKKKLKSQKKEIMPVTSNEELMVYIFSYLPIKELTKNVVLVNKMWHKVVKDYFLISKKDVERISNSLVGLIIDQEKIQQEMLSANTTKTCNIEQFINDSAKLMSEITLFLNKKPYFRVDIPLIIKDAIGSFSRTTILHLLARINLPQLLNAKSFQTTFIELFDTLLKHHVDINAVSYNFGSENSVLVESVIHNNKLMCALLIKKNVDVFGTLQKLIPETLKIKSNVQFFNEGNDDSYFNKLPNEIHLEIMSYLSDKELRLVSKKFHSDYDHAVQERYKKKLQLLIGDEGIKVLSEKVKAKKSYFQLWSHFNEFISGKFSEEMFAKTLSALNVFFVDNNLRLKFAQWNIFSPHDFSEASKIDLNPHEKNHDLLTRKDFLLMFFQKLTLILKNSINDEQLKSVIICNLPTLVIRHFANQIGNNIWLPGNLTLLHYAVLGNHLNSVRFLLTYCDKYKNTINLTCDNYTAMTPLSLACYNLNPEMVVLLLEHGADPNFYDKVKDADRINLPLGIMAASYNGEDEFPFTNVKGKILELKRIVKTLIKHGADVTILDPYSKDALQKFFDDHPDEDITSSRKRDFATFKRG